MPPQSRRHQYLIQQAKQETSDFGRICVLERTVLDLCADLATRYGDDLTPAKGCEIAELILGDSNAFVEFEYRAGYPAKLYGPPENCYPAEDEEITILRAYVNGMWVDALDCFSQRILDQWADQISEMAAQNAADRRHGEWA